LWVVIPTNTEKQIRLTEAIAANAIARTWIVPCCPGSSWFQASCGEPLWSAACAGARPFATSKSPSSSTSESIAAVT